MSIILAACDRACVPCGVLAESHINITHKSTVLLHHTPLLIVVINEQLRNSSDSNDSSHSSTDFMSLLLAFVVTLIAAEVLCTSTFVHCHKWLVE